MLIHTPGPWIYESGMVYTVHGHIPIARMDREAGNGTSPAERDGNARLCAAGPDLRTAVTWLLEDAANGGTRDDTVAYATAALQKATGP